MSTSNAIVPENQLPGTPESVWGLSGPGSTNIEGYTTDISIDHGNTVQFKINTDSSDYRIDIYRLGYYGGDGARLVTTIQHQGDLPTPQPAPLVDPTTGLLDAGNWQVTDSWNIPVDAVSGVYIAKLVREDGTFGENHIPFIVRNDGGQSDIVFQTSDTTWQAYNDWGGHSLYDNGVSKAVSYNRPIANDTPWNTIFGAEYAAIRWLEANGYDVTYMAGVDTDRRGNELLNHKTFLSVGHDEYWSGNQRAWVEAARDSGVNLAFLSGNECYWKIRFEDSIDISGTPYRTLVCYKEFAQKVDPSPEWTGLWRDSLFRSIGDHLPENGLTGTLYMVDWDAEDPLHTVQIPYEFSDLRIWRNTSIANLQPGQTASLAGEYLGYEFNVDRDNGFRPSGLINLSSTNVSTTAINNDPFNPNYGIPDPPGTATHNLTLYRAPSGALVFSAGSIFWSWGLDPHHVALPDGSGTDMPADPIVQQAMVNLFADMGIQPLTLQASLILATQSADHTKPVSTIELDTTGTFASGQTITISGTAADLGGGVIAGVEVSTDGGSSWRKAVGTASWSYSWTPAETGPATILSRAVDDSNNIEYPRLADNFAISVFHQDFAVSQGWQSYDTTRMISDINGDGKADVIGFGDAATYAAMGLGGGRAWYVSIPDFGLAQGYTQANERGADYLGNFTINPSDRFATIWGQGDAGIWYYVATGSTINVDRNGNSNAAPDYETSPRFHGDFGMSQGWSAHYTMDVGFISNTDTYGSILGFGDSGLLVAAQAFDPAATVPDYWANGSEMFGNDAGWDSTIDIRAVRDYGGKMIDVNGDGVMDVIGMGANGFQYAFGQYNNGVYSLESAHTAFNDPTYATFARDQGWTNSSSIRYISDVNNDRHPDIVGFGELGVWLSVGQTALPDGSAAFAQPYLASDNFGTNLGWTNIEHSRILGDINGDGRLDVIGFGDDNTFIATAISDPSTGKFMWSGTSQLHAYAHSGGFLPGQNFRGLADIDGNGAADIVVSGASNLQVIASM